MRGSCHERTIGVQSGCFTSVGDAEPDQHGTGNRYARQTDTDASSAHIMGRHIGNPFQNRPEATRSKSTLPQRLLSRILTEGRRASAPDRVSMLDDPPVIRIACWSTGHTSMRMFDARPWALVAPERGEAMPPAGTEAAQQFANIVGEPNL